MKKKILSIVLALALAVGLLPAFALPAGASVSYERDDSHLQMSVIEVDGSAVGYSVDRYTGTKTALELPDNWNDGVHGNRPVTRIGAYFATSSSGNPVQHLRLGKNIEEIYSNAFYANETLVSVDLPSDSALRRLYGNAFAHCSGLERIGVDGTDRMPATFTDIDQYVFYECSSLTSIDLSACVTAGGNEGLTGLGDCAFAYAGLTSIKLPNTMTGMRMDTFHGCTGLTTLVLPTALTWCWRGEFQDCSNLREIYFPGGLPTGDGTFSGVSSWIGTESFKGIAPDAVIYIPRPATAQEYERYVSDLRNCGAPASAQLRLINVNQTGTVTSYPSAFGSRGVGTGEPRISKNNRAQTAPSVSNVQVRKAGDSYDAMASISTSDSRFAAVVTVQGRKSTVSATFSVSGADDYGWVSVKAYYDGVGIDHTFRDPTDESIIRDEDELIRSALSHTYRIDEGQDNTEVFDHSGWSTDSGDAEDNGYGIYYYWPVAVKRGTNLSPETYATGSKPVKVIYMPTTNPSLSSNPVNLQMDAGGCIFDSMDSPHGNLGREADMDGISVIDVFVDGFETLLMASNGGVLPHAGDPAVAIDYSGSQDAAIYYRWYLNTTGERDPASDALVAEGPAFIQGYYYGGTYDNLLYGVPYVPYSVRKQIIRGNNDTLEQDEQGIYDFYCKVTLVTGTQLTPTGPSSYVWSGAGYTVTKETDNFRHIAYRNDFPFASISATGTAPGTPSYNADAKYIVKHAEVVLTVDMGVPEDVAETLLPSWSFRYMNSNTDSDGYKYVNYYNEDSPGRSFSFMSQGVWDILDNAEGLGPNYFTTSWPNAHLTVTVAFRNHDNSYCHWYYDQNMTFCPYPYSVTLPETPVFPEDQEWLATYKEADPEGSWVMTDTVVHSAEGLANWGVTDDPLRTFYIKKPLINTSTEQNKLRIDLYEVDGAAGGGSALRASSATGQGVPVLAKGIRGRRRSYWVGRIDGVDTYGYMLDGFVQFSPYVSSGTLEVTPGVHFFRWKVTAQGGASYATSAAVSPVFTVYVPDPSRTPLTYFIDQPAGGMGGMAYIHDGERTDVETVYESLNYSNHEHAYDGWDVPYSEDYWDQLSANVWQISDDGMTWHGFAYGAGEPKYNIIGCGATENGDYYETVRETLSDITWDDYDEDYNVGGYDADGDGRVFMRYLTPDGTASQPATLVHSTLDVGGSIGSGDMTIEVLNGNGQVVSNLTYEDMPYSLYYDGDGDGEALRFRATAGSASTIKWRVTVGSAETVELEDAAGARDLLESGYPHITTTYSASGGQKVSVLSIPQLQFEWSQNVKIQAVAERTGTASNGSQLYGGAATAVCTVRENPKDFADSPYFYPYYTLELETADGELKTWNQTKPVILNASAAEEDMPTFRVRASSSDYRDPGMSLSYQWYTSADSHGSGATPIPGATGRIAGEALASGDAYLHASVKLPVSLLAMTPQEEAEGAKNFYVFCRVTNTNPNAVIGLTATSDSARLQVAVRSSNSADLRTLTPSAASFAPSATATFLAGDGIPEALYDMYDARFAEVNPVQTTHRDIYLDMTVWDQFGNSEDRSDEVCHIYDDGQSNSGYVETAGGGMLKFTDDYIDYEIRYTLLGNLANHNPVNSAEFSWRVVEYTYDTSVAQTDCFTTYSSPTYHLVRLTLPQPFFVLNGVGEELTLDENAYGGSGIDDPTTPETENGRWFRQTESYDIGHCRPVSFTPAVYGADADELESGRTRLRWRAEFLREYDGELEWTSMDSVPADYGIGTAVPFGEIEARFRLSYVYASAYKDAEGRYLFRIVTWTERVDEDDLDITYSDGSWASYAHRSAETVSAVYGVLPLSWDDAVDAGMPVYTNENDDEFGSRLWILGETDVVTLGAEAWRFSVPDDNEDGVIDGLDGTLSFQWRRYGDSGWEDVPGATGTKLTVHASDIADETAEAESSGNRVEVEYRLVITHYNDAPYITGDRTCDTYFSTDLYIGTAAARPTVTLNGTASPSTAVVRRMGSLEITLGTAQAPETFGSLSYGYRGYVAGLFLKDGTYSDLSAYTGAEPWIFGYYSPKTETFDGNYRVRLPMETLTGTPTSDTSKWDTYYLDDDFWAEYSGLIIVYEPYAENYDGSCTLSGIWDRVTGEVANTRRSVNDAGLTVTVRDLPEHGSGVTYSVDGGPETAAADFQRIKLTAGESVIELTAPAPTAAETEAGVEYEYYWRADGNGDGNTGYYSSVSGDAERTLTLNGSGIRYTARAYSRNAYYCHVSRYVGGRYVDSFDTIRVHPYCVLEDAAEPRTRIYGASEIFAEEGETVELSLDGTPMSPDGGSVSWIWQIYDGSGYADIPGSSGKTTVTVTAPGPGAYGEFIRVALTNYQPECSGNKYATAYSENSPSLIVYGITVEGEIPDATAGVPVSFPLTARVYGNGEASGQAVVWTVTSPSWLTAPAGTVLTPEGSRPEYGMHSSNTLSGTPSSTGSYPVSVKAAATFNGKTYEATLGGTLDVYAAGLGGEFAPATLDESYSGSVPFTGSVPAGTSWTFTDVPSGMSASAGSSGITLSGTPDVPGTYMIGVKGVKDGDTVIDTGAKLVVRAEVEDGHVAYPASRIFIGGNYHGTDASCSGPGWSWDAEAAVLTLQGYVGGQIKSGTNTPTHIVLKGANNIATTDQTGISIGDWGGAVFHGTGALTIESAGYADGVWGGVTVRGDCNLYIEVGPCAADYTDTGVRGSLDVRAGNVTVHVSAYRAYAVSGNVTTSGEIATVRLEATGQNRAIAVNGSVSVGHTAGTLTMLANETADQYTAVSGSVTADPDVEYVVTGSREGKELTYTVYSGDFPAIPQPENRSAFVGDEVSFTVPVIVNASYPLTLQEMNGLPAGLTATFAEGKITVSGTVAKNAVTGAGILEKDFTVTVHAENSKGSDTRTFTFHVTRFEAGTLDQVWNGYSVTEKAMDWLEYNGLDGAVPGGGPFYTGDTAQLRARNCRGVAFSFGGVSADTSVATVTQNGTDRFTVTAAGEGSTMLYLALSDTDNGEILMTWDIPVTVTDRPPGYDVTGTAVSWNGTDDARYYLYAGTESDAAIRTDVYLDTPANALYTGGGMTVTQNADGKRYDQTFFFPMIPDGTYKLAVMKPGKYVPKIVPVTVSGGAAVLGEVKLWLYGDVTYDGKVRTGDATQIYRMLAGERTFTDEEFAAADVTEDGKVRTGDATHIYKMLAGESSVFDSFV